MFGHDDPGEELELGLSSSRFEVVDEGVFDFVVVEEWKALVAGKCKKTGLIWGLLAFHLLVMWCHLGIVGGWETLLRRSGE